MEYVDNPYYYRVWDNNVDSGKLTFYKLDNKVVYCVEPGSHITDDVYFEEDINTLGLSNNILRDIKLIGYYGYEYPGHDTVNYHIATQALIWERIKNMDVSFWTEKDRGGIEVNVDNEKNEILRLIENHNLNPSIDTNITISKDKEYIFNDYNNVIDSFEIINNNANLNVSIINNELHIKGDIGDYELTLKKKKYNNDTSILYVGRDGISQKMMKLRLDDEKIIKINIHIVGGKIILHKLDSDTLTNKTIGNSTLENAIYGIYDLDNNLIDTIKTNELGEGFSNILKLDKYIIKEITPSYGYELDLNNYEIELNLNNLEINLNVYETLKQIDITLLKTLEGDYTILSGENNITFQIYFKDNNELYKEVTTNEDGVVKFKLPYGDYLIHQVNTNYGYLKADDFFITINEEKEELYKVILDKRIGNIKILKTDSSTNEVLSDALFEVYKLDDNSLIYSGYTNEEGVIEINDLLLGKYKVIEKQSPNGYLLNNLEYIVDITKDKIDYLVNITNTKEEIEVPYTSMNGKKSLKYMGFGLLIIGFIFIIFSKRKHIIKYE